MTHTDIRGFTFFAVCAGILLSGATAPAWTEQDAAVDEGLSDMVVEAENQVLQDIRKTTFEVHVTASVIDTFYSAPDEVILAISPVEGLMPFFNNPESLGSNQAPHPWLRDPAQVPVVTFFPEDPEGHKARRWTLTVTDFRGAPFRHFDGKGKPPKEVEWDGRGNRDEMLQVGYPYSYIFQVVDKGTNTYNYAGVGFRIPAIDFLEGTERRLEFTGNEVFREGRSQLVGSGHDWLTRAADEIRRDHPYSPLRVVVQAENKRLAQDRADEVAAYLTESLMMADDWIQTEAEARPDLRSEMDGSVSIRVEYAEEG